MGGWSHIAGRRAPARLRRTGAAALAAALLATGWTAAPNEQTSRQVARPGAPDHGASRVIREVSYTAPSLRVGRDAFVAVSVATVWRTPESPRAVDAPALTRPARIERWLASMSLTQRRGLYHRADTQALFGDQVRVVRLTPGWARVVVPSQPSQLDARGYPGWVPRRQLTTLRPAASTRRATVITRTAWLRTDQPDGRRLFRISFGTRLPVRSTTPRSVRVVTPTGAVRRLAKAAVVVHAKDEPALVPGRRSLVRTAKGFLGLPYLWAGLSGFGLDCSGLTWLDYRVHGLRIPRDALPQSQHGTRVTTPRRGDLLFYATGGVVHHVSMYVGKGLMIHAPGTGRSVQIVPTATPAYRSEYAGARRYLP